MAFAAVSPLVRRPDRSPFRIGVCAGLGAHLGVADLWVRVVFGLVALSGVGILLYPAAWVLMPNSNQTTTPAERLRARDALDLVAYGMIAIGVGEMLRIVFGSVPWWVAAPISTVAATFVVLFVIARHASGRQFPTTTGEFVAALGTRPGVIARGVTGAFLIAAGSVALLVTSNGWSALRNGVLALGVLFLGVALLLAPWLWRLSVELIEERRERVRSEERADMAAHLHDSVLQTLAMVQRRAENPDEVVRLARRQERELRDWLRSGQASRAAIIGTLGEALAAAAAELEDLHGVAIEVVQVRDCPLTDRGVALVQAAREAIVNAQRHANVANVAVFCEVGDEGATVFVRDRGVGFDRANVSEDRRGLVESIEQRMARHGGAAVVRSELDVGTEVELTMPMKETP